jgi:hypothetical protein
LFTFSVVMGLPIAADVGEGGCNPWVGGHINWDEQTKRVYSETTGMLLQQLGTLKMQCDETCMCCNEVMHRTSIDVRCNKIVAILHQAVRMLSKSKYNNDERHVDRTFSWDSELTKLKQQSVDIHALWLRRGRPRTGVINAERLRVKLLYKNCIRRQKKLAEKNHGRKLASKIVGGDGKSFWRNWRKLKSRNKWAIRSMLFLVM